MGEQTQSAFMPYPQGWLKFVLRLPLLLYRAGMGPLLGWLPLMVLTTRGRKSGLARHVVVEYRRHGSKYYVISGWGTRPHWYQNVAANEEVTVQHGRRIIRGRASIVSDPAELLRAVYLFRRGSPIADRILSSMSSADTIDLATLKRVSQEFTVIRIDRVRGEPMLNGVSVSRGWLAFIIGLVLLLLLVVVMRKQRS